jgi:hypothetical protein
MEKKIKFGEYIINLYISNIKIKGGLMIAPPVVNNIRVYANETVSLLTVYTCRFTTVSATA